MKKIFLATIISGVMSASAMAAPVDAGQGTVTFTGSIIDAACGIDPKSADQTVDLGQVSTTQLANNGASRPVPFTIELVDCDTEVKKTAEVFFSGGKNPNMTTVDALAIQGQAAGAGVVIAGVDKVPVKLDGSKAAGTLDLQDGDNTMYFDAYLKADGKEVVTGQFSALANFTMQYN